MPMNWHKQHEESLSFGDCVADKLASFIGSWKFIIAQTIIFIIWVLLNTLWLFNWMQWDAYPFILFNLFMSAEAAYASPLIMMSQNRQAERDRHQAEADFDCNVAAKEEIETLQEHLSRIEVEKLDQILALLGGGKKFADLEQRVQKIEYDHIQEAHSKF
jgi:uncharacterized membrane protein